MINEHLIVKMNDPMEDKSPDLSLLKEIKQDLQRVKGFCYIRGLRQTTKWMLELLICLQDIEVGPRISIDSPIEDVLEEEYERYDLAKIYFDLEEYDRAAFFTKDCKKDLSKFLHLYSRYLSGEKKKNDDLVDPLTSNDEPEIGYLKELHSEISRLYPLKNEGETPMHSLDAWQLWLYGLVLKRLDLNKEAVNVFCEALHKQPLHWGAWLELAALITDKEMLQNLIDDHKLPEHWMRKFFLAHTYLELQLNDEALQLYTELQDIGLHKSTYIKAQVAITHHNQRDVDQAVSIFKELEATDPYRLDNLDTYSNLLYVKDFRVELAHLAHRIVKIDKYRVETCCVIGNYYSLRSNHEKAVQYFQRALRLNPYYLAAWTLMGHEYMEVKNTNAAIQCYRKAIEINRRDYRAWYGLGQTYEILKLPHYCLYYFKQAQKLRPNDSRMLVALGDSFEKLQKYDEAKKCYLKAQGVGDIEVIALYKLARLYSDQLQELERAAVVYQRYLLETQDVGSSEEKAYAYHFLATYCLQKGMLSLASEYGQKCLQFPETREKGKTFMKEIANKKLHGAMNDEYGSILASRIRSVLNKDKEGNSSEKIARNLSFSQT